MQITNNSKISFQFKTRGGKAVVSSVGSTITVDDELVCSEELIAALKSVGFEFKQKPVAEPEPKRRRKDEVSETEE